MLIGCSTLQDLMVLPHLLGRTISVSWLPKYNSFSKFTTFRGATSALSTSSILKCPIMHGVNDSLVDIGPTKLDIVTEFSIFFHPMQLK